MCLFQGPRRKHHSRHAVRRHSSTSMGLYSQNSRTRSLDPLLTWSTLLRVTLSLRYRTSSVSAVLSLYRRLRSLAPGVDHDGKCSVNEQEPSKQSELFPRDSTTSPPSYQPKYRHCFGNLQPSEPSRSGGGAADEPTSFGSMNPPKSGPEASIVSMSVKLANHSSGACRCSTTEPSTPCRQLVTAYGGHRLPHWATQMPRSYPD